MTSSETPRPRRILTIDGGGVRGVLTVKLLASLEQRLKDPGYVITNSRGARPSGLLDFFDMVAGTSTGSIIVGLLQMGHSPAKILELYQNLASEAFRKGPLWPARALLARMYSNVPLKRLALELFGDKQLWELPKDTMVVARDMVRSESTFFTAFKLKEDPQGPQDVYGTYKRVRLRDAVLASASAPIYLPPHGRFVDGGVGSFNNTCLSAPIEALAYSGPSEWELWEEAHPGQQPDPGIQTWKRHVQRYLPGHVIVYSFGTGNAWPQRRAQQVRKMRLRHWATAMTGEFMGEINEQQTDIASRYVNLIRYPPPPDVLTPAFRLHRYQIFFTKEGFDRIGAKWSDRFRRMDMTDASTIPALTEVGERFAEAITKESLWDEEQVALSSPRPRERRVPQNVSVLWGKPLTTPDYGQDILAAFNEVKWPAARRKAPG